MGTGTSKLEILLRKGWAQYFIKQINFNATEYRFRHTRTDVINYPIKASTFGTHFHLESSKYIHIYTWEFSNLLIKFGVCVLITDNSSA